MSAALRSGWLTSGPRSHRFEEEFAAAVGAAHAVAVNSCTAALHLAVEALGLKAGQGVLVPTMTFAATAEIVRYLGAIPILVDCDPLTANLDLRDAARKIEQLRSGELPGTISRDTRVVGIIPVHVGGSMMNIAELQHFAGQHGLWMVEDAAHAFPAAWRPGPGSPWQRCGEATAAVSCFSFYANKTITTGEGGMLTTNDETIARRVKVMRLHGIDRDIWRRFTTAGSSWEYDVVAPGYKYNMPDINAAIGLAQLENAWQMRAGRQRCAEFYMNRLAGLPGVDLPRFHVPPKDHAWHLYSIVLTPEAKVARNRLIEFLAERGIGTSVHYKPLHRMTYYRDHYKLDPANFREAERIWQGCVSLPIYPALKEDELEYIGDVLWDILG